MRGGLASAHPHPSPRRRVGGRRAATVRFGWQLLQCLRILHCWVFSTKPGPQFATRIVIQMQLLQLNKAPQLQLDKALQLQLKRHYGSNSANASIATSRALQLQLWTCNFYNLYQTNCNSTSTLVATRQALQLQLFKNHFNCNSTRTPVGTPQTLQQLLDHFGCNSEHVIFIRWIATQQALQL
jgi:hypothetical protein